jgi:hypothetical protein
MQIIQAVSGDAKDVAKGRGLAVARGCCGRREKPAGGGCWASRANKLKGPAGVFQFGSVFCRLPLVFPHMLMMMRFYMRGPCHRNSYTPPVVRFFSVFRFKNSKRPTLTIQQRAP